ncbi:MAG: NVEALA domain-containing protein [Bacteroidales bacterium]|nr:NVEALA domain-containing protein [Bacteroidales bacterium]
MKKTIILSIALVCIALGTSLSSYLTMKENLSSMAIANLEALTYTEDEIEDENCDEMQGATCIVTGIVADQETGETFELEGYVFNDMECKID